MQNPNNSNNQNQDENQTQLQEEKQGQETTKKVVESPEDTSQETNPKQENEAFKRVREAEKRQAKKVKELEKKLAELENNKPDKTVEDELKELKVKLENEKLERIKQSAINQALENGLNPAKKAIFEKYHLNHLVEAEDITEALADFKQELPELFTQGKNLATASFPSGSNNRSQISKAKALEILSSGDNSLYIKYQKEIKEALKK
jgi:hypothetical protein